jgi:Ca2+-binding EF-hand superfamily protein
MLVSWMGCFSPKRRKFVPSDTIEGQDVSVLEILGMLELTDYDIDLLYNAFLEIDADDSGSIRPVELFSYFNIELGVFEKYIFTMFDEDKSGLLNFMEFACAMWNFLTLQECDLGTLMYLMKEPTGKLRIKYSDIKDVLEYVHKRKLESSAAMQALFQALKRDYSGELSIADIINWIRTNPSIISPILVLQLKLRKDIIGEGFWLEQMAYRRQHPEFQKHLFIKTLQKQVALKNENFKREKYKQQEADEKKLRTKGLFQGIRTIKTAKFESGATPITTSSDPSLKPSKQLRKPESSSQNLLDEVDSSPRKSKPPKEGKLKKNSTASKSKIAGAGEDLS